MLLFFVLGRDSLEQASEQAASLGEQVLAAETGSFTTPSSPGDADSSLMSGPHALQGVCTLTRVFLPYIFSTTTVRTPMEVLGKVGCVILQWLLCQWN